MVAYVYTSGMHAIYLIQIHGSMILTPMLKLQLYTVHKAVELYPQVIKVVHRILHGISGLILVLVIGSASKSVSGMKTLHLLVGMIE